MCSTIDLLYAWFIGAASVGFVIWFWMDWKLRRALAATKASGSAGSE